MIFLLARSKARSHDQGIAVTDHRQKWSAECPIMARIGVGVGLMLLCGLPMAMAVVSIDDPTKSALLYGQHCLRCHGAAWMDEGPMRRR
jgi:mono/diheme cytochrome c family protein